MNDIQQYRITSLVEVIIIIIIIKVIIRNWKTDDQHYR